MNSESDIKTVYTFHARSGKNIFMIPDNAIDVYVFVCCNADLHFHGAAKKITIYFKSDDSMNKCKITNLPFHLEKLSVHSNLDFPELFTFNLLEADIPYSLKKINIDFQFYQNTYVIFPAINLNSQLTHIHVKCGTLFNYNTSCCIEKLLLKCNLNSKIFNVPVNLTELIIRNDNYLYEFCCQVPRKVKIQMYPRNYAPDTTNIREILMKKIISKNNS